MKRIFALCLILAVTIAVVPVRAAQSDFEIRDGVLVKYRGPGGDVVIPNSVTSISRGAFQDCTSLESITIPGSVASVGELAFENCTGLSHVVIEYGVSNIGFGAFEGCTNLSRVSIPSSVTTIEYRAFEACANLATIDLPNQLNEIESRTFYGCTGLKNITIPDSVTTIGASAFDSCASLTSITIGRGVTDIDTWTFLHCPNLADIYVSPSNPRYTIVDGVLINKDKREILKYPGGSSATTYTVPNSVTSITQGAFWDCANLVNITIPDSVTWIGSDVFANCPKLTNVTLSNSLTAIYGGTFSNCPSLMKITIPSSVTQISGSFYRSCPSLSQIHVAAGNQNYADVDGVLFNKDKTTLVRYPAGKQATAYTVPDSVTQIGWFAFADCANLDKVTMPDSVTALGYCAFKNCTKLTNVAISDNLTEIDAVVFSGCSSLIDIVIPTGIIRIGEEAFGGCSRLANVYFRGTQAQWNAIWIDSYNDPLISAVIHCNYDPANPPGIVTSDMLGAENGIVWTYWDDGVLSLDQTVQYGQMVLVSAYDNSGRFTGAKLITAEQRSTDLGYPASFKLFWLNDLFAPQCEAVAVEN